MRLSNHFTLEELTFSSTAQRMSIDNTPSERVVQNLSVLAQGLEEVRSLLGFPMHIDSGYRSMSLNHAVGGSTHSAHMDGYAADFTCHDFGTPLEIVRTIASSSIKFDKCIQEGDWVHISFSPALSRTILTAHFTPSGVYYSKGVSH